MKSVIISAALLGCQLCEETPMKFVNSQNGFVILEVKKEGDILFYDEILEEEMREMGIQIPPHLRKEFEGQEVIYLKDKAFLKAFKEVYCQMVFNPAIYEWK